jgi:hypothetical protein
VTRLRSGLGRGDASLTRPDTSKPVSDARKGLPGDPSEGGEGGDAPISDIRNVVVVTLRALALDQTAPASARAQACRTLAEIAGMLKPPPSRADTGTVSELSEGELDALIAARMGQPGGAKL